MKLSKLMMATMLASTGIFIGCSDDDDNGTTTTVDGLAAQVNADGDWNSDVVALFESKIQGNRDAATGANETVFSWTSAKGGTTLPAGDGLTTTAVLEGEITEDMTLEADKVYELKGAVFVRSGATLTIPAGTLIVADRSNNAFVDQANNVTAADVLIVNKGAKLMANGTAAEPIIFTSKEDAAGTWGGIVLLGDAPINISNGNAEIADNVNEDLPYGGANNADNSGVLNYIILVNPGNQINTDAEYNGFSFYAVGTGTTLSNLEVVNGKDDGFEWFGGTVSASNLIAAANDDTFDWAEGFVGTLDNIVANQPNGADHCIEADNLRSNNDATPRSMPTIMNATFNSADGDDAIKLRRGTAAKFSNVVINMSSADNANFEIDDLVTAQKIEDGTTTFQNVKIDTDNASFDGNINL